MVGACHVSSAPGYAKNHNEENLVNRMNELLVNRMNELANKMEKEISSFSQAVEIKQKINDKLIERLSPFFAKIITEHGHDQINALIADCNKDYEENAKMRIKGANSCMWLECFLSKFKEGDFRYLFGSLAEKNSAFDLNITESYNKFIASFNAYKKNYDLLLIAGQDIGKDSQLATRIQYKPRIQYIEKNIETLAQLQKSMLEMAEGLVNAEVENEGFIQCKSIKYPLIFQNIRNLFFQLFTHSIQVPAHNTRNAYNNAGAIALGAAGLAGVAYAGYKAYQNWDSIKDFAKQTANKASGAVSGAKNWAKTLFKKSDDSEKLQRDVLPEDRDYLNTAPNGSYQNINDDTNDDEDTNDTATSRFYQNDINDSIAMPDINEEAMNTDSKENKLLDEMAFLLNGNN
jgi:hypothetical protein